MTEQLARKKLTEWIKSDDIDILQIPPKIFHPYRILILKILYMHSGAEFRELKQDLNLTDGNLASHLRALEAEGYITVDKQIVDRKPRTAYVLTKEGFNVYRQFRERIAKVIKNDL